MRRVSCLVSGVILTATAVYGQTTWTTLDYPGAYSTWAYGVSGDNIVGAFSTSADAPSRGFLYNGLAWQALDYPGAQSTSPQDVSGENIVGDYTDSEGAVHGFLRSGETWTTLDYPGARSTHASGIDGNTVVGTYYDDMGSYHGFVYRDSIWSTLDCQPFGITTTVPTKLSGIDGNMIVGGLDPNIMCLYDGSQWTTAYTGASITAYGISGNKAVGDTYFTKGGDFTTYGMIADFSNKSIRCFKYPGSIHTTFYGTDGDRIVGACSLDYSGQRHGLIMVPEPGTITLLVLGAWTVLRRRT